MGELTWMKVARSFYGMREIPGAKHNPDVVRLFGLAGHPEIHDDETAWCAAYVGGVLHLAGMEGTGSLSARSYEQWGQPLDHPMYGCVGVKKRTGGAAWQGHVGFVVGASDSEIFLLGGNQSNMVSVAGFDRREFTALRYPPGVDFPKEPRPLPMTIMGAAVAVSEG